jgi:hypothetical protein
VLAQPTQSSRQASKCKTGDRNRGIMDALSLNVGCMSSTHRFDHPPGSTVTSHRVIARPFPFCSQTRKSPKLCPFRACGTSQPLRDKASISLAYTKQR